MGHEGHSDPQRRPFEAILDGAVILDAATGRILQANNVAAAILNFASPEEMVGLNPVDYVRDEDREPVAVLLAQSLEADRPTPAEFGVKTKDGTLVWVSVTSTLVEHEGKRASLITIREITSEKAKSLALREAEHLYQRLFETMVDGAVVLDVETNKVMLANSSSASIFGFASPEEMVGRNPLDYVPEEDRERVVRLIADSIERGYLPATEIRIRNKDGRPLWVSVSASIVQHEGKKATLATVRDLTTDKEREAALREAESRYEHLFEGMLDGAVVLDISSFQIAYANRAAAEMFGFESPREVIGENPLSYIPEEYRDNVARMIALNLEGKGQNPAEIRIVTKDRRYLWISATATRIEYEGRTATLATLRDITADKAKDDALRAAEESRLQLMDAASEGITIVQDGKLVYVNSAIAQGAGIPREQLMGLAFLDLIHPDERLAVWQRYERILAGEWPSEIATMRGLNVKGETLWAEVREIPFTWRGRPAIMSLIHDITDRMRLEEERKEREERLRAIIENSWDGITVLDDNYNVTFESPSLARISGHTPEEWIGRPVGQMLIHPDDLAMLATRMETLKSQPGSVIEGVVVRYQHKDGSWRWIEATGHNLLNDPKVKGLVVNFRDITDRIEAEEDLKASEERFRTLIEKATDVVIVLDASGKITYQSPSLERVTGFGPYEWLDRSLGDLLIHPDDMPGLTTLLQQVLAKPSATIEGITVRYQHKDRSWHTLEATVTNMLHDPNVNGIVANFRDITDRKAIQEALAEGEEKYRLLVENSNDVIFSLDPQGNFTYVSPAIERISGYRVEEVVGTSFTRFVVPEDLPGLMTSFENTLRGSLEAAEFRALTKDGSVRHVRTTSRVAVQGGKVTGLTGVMSDITQRKEAEEALKRSEALLRDTQELASVGGWEYDVERNEAIWTEETYRIHDIPNIPAIDHVAESMKCYPPPERQTIAQAFQKCLEEGTPYDLELPFVTFAGKQRWVRTSARAIREGDRVVRVLGTIADITERKHAADDLRASEERNRLLIDNAAEVVTVVQDGLIAFINRNCLDLSGYSPEELISKPFIELIHPDDRQMVAENYVKRLHREAVPTGYSFRVVHKSGDIRWAAASVTLFTWEGKPATLGLLTDITDRQKAEEALEESEAKYKRLFESTQMAIEVVSMETGKIVLANEAVAEMFGFASPEDVYAIDTMQHIRPEDVGWVSTMMARAAAGQSPRQIAELQVRTKDGRWLWVSCSADPTEYKGKPALLVSLLDITSRKQAEETLRESEQKYRLLTEKTDDVIYTVDLDFNNTYVSPSVERILGFTAEEYLGLSPDQRMTLESLARAQVALLEHLSLEKDPNADPNRTVRIELEFYRKDGSTVWLEHQVSGLRDVNGTAIGLHGVARDITERRRAEEALVDSEAVYKRLFEHTQTAMEVISGETGLVVLANETTARMFGFASADDLIGVDSMEYLLPEDRDRVATQMAQALADKTWSQGTELRVRTKDGRLLWINGLVTTTEYQGKPALLISLVDLTASKQAEETLRASEEKYRFLAEKTNDVIWTADLSLRTTYVSPSVEKVLGFTPDERLAQDPARQMTPESFARAAEALAHHLALEEDPKADPNRTLRIELEYYRKDGALVWLENQVSGIRDANGKLVSFHGVARDISERRQAESAVRETRDRYRALFDRSVDAVYVHDFEGNFIDANDAALSLLGYDREDIPHISFATLLSEDQIPTALAVLQELMETGTQKNLTQYALRRKDGELVHVETVASVIQREGKPYAVQGIARDITESRKAAQALTESEEKYRLLAEKTNDIIWTADLNLGATYFSPSVERVLGLAPEERLKRNFADIMTPESLTRAQEALAHHLALEQDPSADPNRIVRIELEYYHKDGSTVWMEEQVSGIRDANGTLVGFHGVARDISERKQAEKALNERLKELQCIAGISRLAEKPGLPIEEFVKEAVGLLPTAWQYPDICCARIAMDSKEFKTPNFRDTEWSQSADIRVDAKKFGTVTVCYLKEMPEADEGPFLKEERALIETIADFLGHVIQHRQMEQSLRASEERHRLLAQNASDIIWLVDANLKISYSSPSATSLLGYQPDEFTALSFDSLLTADSLANVTRVYRDAMAEEKNIPGSMKDVTLDIEVVRKDSSTVWLEAAVTVVRDQEGRFAGFQGACRDITERRRARQALIESEERYRLLVNNAAEAIAVIQDGLVKFINPKGAELVGRASEELTPAPFLDYVHPDDRQMMIENHAKRLAGQEVSNNYTFRILDKQGSTKHIQINAVMFKWEGKPAVLAMLNDITDRVKIQEALMASEANYRDLFEHTLLGMEVVDLQTLTTVLANRSLARMFGFKSAGDMIGTKPLDYVLPENLEWVSNQIAELMATPSWDRKVDIKARTEDGRDIWVTGMATPFEYEGRPAMLISLVDITAAKDAEDRLRDSEEKNRVLIDNAAEAIAVIQDGIAKFFNRRLVELTGWTAEELLSKSFLDLVHPDEREMIALNYMKRIAGEEVPNNYQFRIIDKDGNTRWLQINAVRFDWEGKPATLDMFSEVTEQVKAEQALRDSEERFRALVEKATDAVAVLDAAGNVRYYTPSMYRVTGYGPGEWVDKSLSDLLLHPDDLPKLVSVLEEVLREPGGSVENFTTRYQHRDGTWHVLEATARNMLHDPKIGGIVANFRDITERVKAEEKLKESEERYRLLAENAADIIWVVDVNLRVTYASPSLTRLLGYTAEDVADGAFVNKLLKPDSLSSMAEEFVQDLAAEEARPGTWSPRLVEIEVVSKDGLNYWLEAAISGIRDTEGRLIAFQGACRDITERVKADRALKESEERYRLLADNSSDVIWLFDTNLKLVYASPSVATVLGYSVEEVKGIGLERLLTPNSLATVTEKYAEALARESGSTPSTTTRTLQVEMVRKDGSTMVVEVVTTAMHDSEGRLLGFQGACRDVTERVRAEEQLRDSEERFRGLVETTSDWVWEMDRNSRYTYVSPRVRDVLGYEPEELLGHTPFQFMHQREGRRVSKIVRRFAAEHLPFSLLENTCVHKDGHSVVMETSAVPIIGNDGSFLGYRGIDRDITDRKKVEQELQRSLKRLEKTMESTIEAITNTIETRDPYTTGHQMRVTDLACAIAKAMEISPTQIEGIRVAGLLHDIGKIAIPTEILSKPGKLNEVEYEMIKTHSKVGYNILKKIEFPWPVARTVLQHHERWNGSGYPHGIRGDDILIEARILAVADVVEAMSSHRPYRPTVGADKALEEISKNSGILYDPAVAAACITAFTQGGFKFASSSAGAAGEAESISSIYPAQSLEDS